MAPVAHAVTYSFTRTGVIGLLIFAGFLRDDLFPSIYITIGAVIVLALILDWLISRFFNAVVKARCGNCRSSFRMYFGKRDYNYGQRMREVKYRCHKCEMRLQSGIFVF